MISDIMLRAAVPPKCALALRYANTQDEETIVEPGTLSGCCPTPSAVTASPSHGVVPPQLQQKTSRPCILEIQWRKKVVGNLSPVRLSSNKPEVGLALDPAQGERSIVV
jgi:hypothetical protein